MTMHYLGYGRTANRDFMAELCPDAKPLGGHYLPNHRLIFRGHADIRFDRDFVLPVVAWEITNECLSALDELADYPKVYDRRKINDDWWIYDMNGNKDELAAPSNQDYHRIMEAYEDFGPRDYHLRVALRDAGFDLKAI